MTLDDEKQHLSVVKHGDFKYNGIATKDNIFVFKGTENYLVSKRMVDDRIEPATKEIGVSDTETDLHHEAQMAIHAMYFRKLPLSNRISDSVVCLHDNQEFLRPKR